LKEGGKTTAGHAKQRMRNILVVAEIAMALVLLVGGGLMMRSLIQLLNVDPGFQTDRLLTFNISLPGRKYAQSNQVVGFYQQLREKIATLPGVTGVDITTKLPLEGGDTTNVYVSGQPKPAPGNELEVNFRDIGNDYLQILGTKIVKGRFFTDQDRAGKPSVTVINQTLATRLFADQNPIGQRLEGIADQPSEIVGVIADLKETGLDNKSMPAVYEPILQSPSNFMEVVVRSTIDPESLINSARREVLNIDPNLPISNAISLDHAISLAQPVFLRRYSALLIGVFAMVALFLAIIGTYGVISYSVSQQTQEMAIRLALGAQRSEIFKLVIGKGMITAVAGVVTGLVVSIILTRFLTSFLFNVSPTDPLTLGGISVLLTAVAILACYLPARRATQVDPMVALRSE
jgi:predicted permease